MKTKTSQNTRKNRFLRLGAQVLLLSILFVFVFSGVLASSFAIEKSAINNVADAATGISVSGTTTTIDSSVADNTKIDISDSLKSKYWTYSNPSTSKYAAYINDNNVGYKVIADVHDAPGLGTATHTLKFDGLSVYVVTIYYKVEVNIVRTEGGSYAYGGGGLSRSLNGSTYTAISTDDGFDEYNASYGGQTKRLGSTKSATTETDELNGSYVGIVPSGGTITLKFSAGFMCNASAGGIIGIGSHDVQIKYGSYSKLTYLAIKINKVPTTAEAKSGDTMGVDTPYFPETSPWAYLYTKEDNYNNDLVRIQAGNAIKGSENWNLTPQTFGESSMNSNGYWAVHAQNPDNNGRYTCSLTTSIVIPSSVKKFTLSFDMIAGAYHDRVYDQNKQTYTTMSASLYKAGSIYESYTQTSSITINQSTNNAGSTVYKDKKTFSHTYNNDGYHNGDSTIYNITINIDFYHDDRRNQTEHTDQIAAISAFLLNIEGDYTANYDGFNSGSNMPTAMVYNESTEVTAPSSRDGYTFDGWTLGGTNPTYSTAKWGTDSSTSNSVSSSSTKCINGTTGSVYFKNLTNILGGTVTLTAGWEANTGTITYDANGATGVSNMPANTPYNWESTETQLHLSTTIPSREGYIFLGWASYANRDASDPDYAPNARFAKNN